MYDKVLLTDRVVLAEMGRWPLALRWYKRIAKFYNGLLDAREEGLLGRSLSVSCQLALGTADSIPIGRRPWAGQIAAAFQKVGINMDLESRSGLNIDTVTKNSQAWYLQSTRAAIGTKIHHYVHQVREGLPEDGYLAPPYFSIVKRRADRRSLTQIRTGSHWLREETGRWERLEREQRVCPHCAQSDVRVIEDVEHMLFSCPSYSSVRDRYQCLNFSDINLHQFLQQDPIQLASFSTACWQQYKDFEVAAHP